MHSRSQQFWLHAVLLLLAALTYVPFAFVLNSSLRSNEEMYDSFFGIPEAFKTIITGKPSELAARIEGTPTEILTKGYVLAWEVLRRYMLNSILVSGASAVLVVILGSITAYVLSRYRFRGSKVVFAVVLSTMMVPAATFCPPCRLTPR